MDLQLEEREPPETLYHGTVERFLPSILKEGLIRGNGTMSICRKTWRPHEGRSQTRKAGHPHSRCRSDASGRT